MSKTFEQGKEEVAGLCRHFTANRQEFLAPGVKEAHICQMLIEPFFEALGWDVRSAAKIAPQYREVIPQDSLDVEGQQKAPDYAFRVGTLPKFYVEAKKCGVNISTDPSPAFQLRRYGWSAKLALSILTDFEELAVYDCTLRPKQGDKASRARVFYFAYEEYPDRWRELWDIFSREAVWSGAFDQYAASKRKRGTSEVDEEFLKEIEGWRDVLARNIALRNKDISSDDLNAAVQSTIDRVVFLRMAEDRRLEPSDQLLKLCEQDDIYARFMRDLCRKADEKYNSGLFHFQKERDTDDEPDRLTPKLKVDDRVFKQILHSLYFEHGSPYQFGVLPVEILGTIYERFLGKVIRLTAGHQAKVEEKPEVRKAGGVYYTPAYIVDYIVRNTVGRKIEDRSPMQLAGLRNGRQPLRIMDMACGSGSFLLGAYQCLLDHCLKWYIEHKPGSCKKAVYKDLRDGHWRLTIAEKKRILTAHIFGVDIDTQAVEVTKLSLLLKVLEGETDQTVGQNMQLFNDRALPNLCDNIKCGNSLIGPDYFIGRLPGAAEDELELIRPFSWERGFPEAMKAGGFDCIIGNPPWGGDIDNVTWYIKLRYPDSTQSYRDSFKLFIDRAIQLAKPGGFVSLIVPSAFMFQPRYLDVRRLLRRFRICNLWNVGDKVFSAKVVAPSCVFLLHKQKPEKNARVAVLDTSDVMNNNERENIAANASYRLLPQSLYDKTTDETFVTFYRKLGPKESRLGDVLDCKDCGIKHQRVGCGMEQKGKSDLAKRLYYEGPKKSVRDHRFLIGADLSNSCWHIDFTAERYFRADYKKILREDEIVYFNEEVFDLSEKIVWRQTSDRIRAAIVGSHWFANTLQAGILLNHDYDLRYILGLLNSTFLNFIYLETVREMGRVFPQVKLAKVRSLPFRTIDFGDPADLRLHDRMVSLVDSMVGLHKQLAVAKSETQKTVIQRRIEATDEEINRLVYDLYGLTAEEIENIEETTK